MMKMMGGSGVVTLRSAAHILLPCVFLGFFFCSVSDMDIRCAIGTNLYGARPVVAQSNGHLTRHSKAHN